MVSSSSDPSSSLSSTPTATSSSARPAPPPSTAAADAARQQQQQQPQPHQRTASASTLALSSRKPSEASTVGLPASSSSQQYGSAGRRKVRTEPPFAQRQPPTPPDSPGQVASHLFASGSSSHHHRQPSSAAAASSRQPTASTSTLPPPLPPPANQASSSRFHLLPAFAPGHGVSTASPTRTRFSSDQSESGGSAGPSANGGWGSGSLLLDVEKQQQQQQQEPLEGRGLGLGLDGVDEEDAAAHAAAAAAGGRRPSWWANSTSSFIGKFGGSGSSATPMPGEGSRSYFPSILGGGAHTPNSLTEGRETASPTHGAGESSPLPPVSPSPSGYATPTRPRRASHRPNFRLSLPTPTQPFASYTAHQSKTPGWAEPYSASFPSRRSNFHARSLSRARGDHLTGKELGSAGGRPGALSGADEDDDGRRPSLRKRIQRWTLYAFWTPLFVRLANFALTCTTLGLGVRIRNLESAASLSGITGPSPLVAIVYSPPTLVHVLAAVYLEYFGKPVGLWSLPSKLLFTSLDLVVICLWASLLSLTMSDIFTSPLHCAPESSRWWTNVRQTDTPAHVDGVCASQVAMTVSVVVGVVGFLLGNVVSLARVWARMVDRTGGGGGGGGGGRGGRIGLGFGHAFRR